MTNHKSIYSPMRTLIVISGILLLFSFGCAVSGNKKPDWVDRHSAKYPESHYLQGVGYGDNERSAERNAYAAIARIFQVSVKQNQKEVTEYLTTQTDDDTQTEWQVKANEITEISTQKTIEGAEIVETWVDSTQQVYKLAVLDRKKSTRILGERIAELDGSVNRHARIVLDSTNKLRVARSYYSMIQMIMKRDAYNSDYRIIHHKGQGRKFNVPLATVSEDLRKFLAKKFNIAVRITGPNSEKVRNVLAERLTKAGFSILGQSAETPSIIIKGELTFKKLDIPSKNKFIRWRASFQLINQADNKEFGSISKNGREAHVNFEAAEERALRTLTKQVNQKIARDVFTFVFGNDS
jgi:LPP20 lipoprotein